MLVLTLPQQCLNLTSQYRANVIAEHGVMTGCGFIVLQRQAPCAGSKRQPAVHGVQEGLGAL